VEERSITGATPSYGGPYCCYYRYQCLPEAFNFAHCPHYIIDNLISVQFCTVSEMKLSHTCMSEGGVA